MDIRVVEEKGRSQIEVTILSGPDDQRVSGIVRQLQMADGKLSGYVPGTIKRRVVFLAIIHLTTGEVLESDSRLFELEEALRGTEFVRASRQELVNLDYVTGISPAGSGRILLSLSEKNLVASRKYASDIKKRIGIL